MEDTLEGYDMLPCCIGTLKKPPAMTGNQYMMDGTAPSLSPRLYIHAASRSSKPRPPRIRMDVAWRAGKAGRQDVAWTIAGGPGGQGCHGGTS